MSGDSHASYSICSFETVQEMQDSRGTVGTIAFASEVLCKDSKDLTPTRRGEVFAVSLAVLSAVCSFVLFLKLFCLVFGSHQFDSHKLWQRQS